jgi:conjugal transfer pilus assembly protein TraW
MSVWGSNHRKTNKKKGSPFALLWIPGFLVALPKMLPAKDCGTFGATFLIQETSLLELIMSRLHLRQEKEGFQEPQQRIAHQAAQAALNPRSVDGLRKVVKSRTWTFDPGITLKQDLVDAHGKVLIPKGQAFTPLSQVRLSKPLVFFDGEDNSQRAWVLKNHFQSKLILVRGQPLALSEEWGTRVYFDQGGGLTRKLQIQAVPAVVSQEGEVLKIQEVVVGERS